MIRLTLSTGEPIALKPAPVRKFRGTRLPGSQLYKAEQAGFAIAVQEFRQPSYQLCYRSLYFKDEYKLNTTEQVKGLRLETVLSGELQARDVQGNEILLLPGQYHITDTPVFQSHFRKDQGCTYFSAYYSPELIERLGLAEPLTAAASRPMPAAMQELVYELLDNPFEESLRPFYYKNSILELLFLHVSAPPFAWPGELTTKQIASMYEVDRFMAENLDSKIKIRDLAKLIGTNSFFLKRAYEQVFGIGVFARLLQRRMERAKFLLEKTDKPLKDICELAGYETLAGFITEFRKRFDMTPNEWRKSRRGL